MNYKYQKLANRRGLKLKLCTEKYNKSNMHIDIK